MHFRIPFLALVFGGAGGIDVRGIKDCAFSQHHSSLLQHLAHTLKDLLSGAVLFQEMTNLTGPLFLATMSIALIGATVKAWYLPTPVAWKIQTAKMMAST